MAVDWTRLFLRAVAGPCEYGNEFFVSVKDGNCHLLRQLASKGRFFFMHYCS